MAELKYELDPNQHSWLGNHGWYQEQQGVLSGIGRGLWGWGETEDQAAVRHRKLRVLDALMRQSGIGQ